MKLIRFSHLFILWLVAIGVSTIVFVKTYNEFPTISDVIFGHLIYGILALPFSFLHSVTFHSGEVIRIFGFSFFLLILSYWSILFGCQLIYIKRGGKLLLLISTIVILISAVRWLYYAMAMSGI